MPKLSHICVPFQNWQSMKNHLTLTTTCKDIHFWPPLQSLAVGRGRLRLRLRLRRRGLSMLRIHLSACSCSKMRHRKPKDSPQLYNTSKIWFTSYSIYLGEPHNGQGSAPPSSSVPLVRRTLRTSLKSTHNNINSWMLSLQWLLGHLILSWLV